MISRPLRLALTLPGLLYLGLCSAGLPCALVLVLAAFERGIYGGIDWSVPPLDNFGRALDPLYLRHLPRLGAHRRAPRPDVALLIGYPAAYAIALQPARGSRRSCSCSSCCRSGPTT